MPAFATINPDLSYWQKQTKPLFADLAWNLPERKTGHLAIIGGNQQSFSTPVRIAEQMTANFPFQTITTVLPDVLERKIPVMANITFAPSTASGSFDKSPKLTALIRQADGCLIIGDLSRNSATTVALADALKPDTAYQTNLAVIARDSVDLLTPEASRWLTRDNTIVIASMLQLQKLFRAVYYPRMIMLTQPLLPVLETLHKFTLSYPTTLLTFHQEQIIVASHGQVSTTHIVDTAYTPLSLWLGQLAGNVTALNFYNPGKPFEATTAAILYRQS